MSLETTIADTTARPRQGSFSRMNDRREISRLLARPAVALRRRRKELNTALGA